MLGSSHRLKDKSQRAAVGEHAIRPYGSRGRGGGRCFQRLTKTIFNALEAPLRRPTPSIDSIELSYIEGTISGAPCLIP